MWYLLLQDTGITYSLDELNSELGCNLAKIKLMERQASLLKEASRDSFITKIECKEAQNV